MNLPRERVRHAFGHARDYEGKARVQREVAAKLAMRIAKLDLPASPRVLEIGCGTGFLTSAMREAGICGDWLITDVAPEMVERCRERMGDAPGMTFEVLDGEYGALPEGEFHLICSSLAVQWFDDAPAALARLAGLLAPGGHLIVTTLGPGSFAQWRAAHAAEGLTPGTPNFTAVDAFAALQPTSLEVETVTEEHASGRDFVRALKAIGAATADTTHRPLSPARLRRVLAQFDRTGSKVSYEIVTCHLHRAR